MAKLYYLARCLPNTLWKWKKLDGRGRASLVPPWIHRWPLIWHFSYSVIADDPELDAQVPAPFPRRVRRAEGRGQLPDGELQNLHLHRNQIHGRHSLPEPQGEYNTVFCFRIRCSDVLSLKNLSGLPLLEILSISSPEDPMYTFSQYLHLLCISDMKQHVKNFKTEIVQLQV